MWIILTTPTSEVSLFRPPCLCYSHHIQLCPVHLSYEVSQLPNVLAFHAPTWIFFFWFLLIFARILLGDDRRSPLPLPPDATLPGIQIEVFTWLAIFFNFFIKHILERWSPNFFISPFFTTHHLSCVDNFHHPCFRIFSSGTRISTV